MITKISNMYDLEALRNSYLPIDKLIYEFRISVPNIKDFEYHTKYTPTRIVFHSYITLPFVQDPQIRKKIQMYIARIITFKKEYGYLYYLNNEKLIRPIHLHFNGELIIDPSDYLNIFNEINNLAKQFACPSKNYTLFKITLIEILYFLTILINPYLNWITVDYILRGNRTHDYLISFKDRVIAKTWPTID